MQACFIVFHKFFDVFNIRKGEEVIVARLMKSDDSHKTCRFSNLDKRMKIILHGTEQDIHGKVLL